MGVRGVGALRRCRLSDRQPMKYTTRWKRKNAWVGLAWRNAAFSGPCRIAHFADLI
jgi:hypothetical protein